MDLKLEGKKALVMGSSSGIGHAIARSLAREKAQVALCARSEDKLAAAAKEMGAKTYVVADLSQPGSGRAAVEKATQALGGLDILVVNGGGPKKGAFADIPDSQWHEDFQSVWMSAVESMRAALPAMKKSRFGRIILITSLAAKEPLPGLTTSNGLRAGHAGLAKSVSTEVAPFGITINLVLPGYTATERLKELKLSDEKIIQMVPAGRLADPSELGDLAAYLCSAQAGYITGQSIAIDGGAMRGH